MPVPIPPDAKWDLGDDNLARNTRKALEAAGITPAHADRMTEHQLSLVRGLGTARLERVGACLERMRNAPAADDSPSANGNPAMTDHANDITVDVDLHAPEPNVRAGKLWMAFHEGHSPANVAYYADLTTALSLTARWYWRGVYGHITKPVVWRSFAGGGLWQLHDADGHTGVVLTMADLHMAVPAPVTGDDGDEDDRWTDAELINRLSSPWPEQWSDVFRVLAERVAAETSDWNNGRGRFAAAPGQTREGLDPAAIVRNFHWTLIAAAETAQEAVGDDVEAAADDDHKAEWREIHDRLYRAADDLKDIADGWI